MASFHYKQLHTDAKASLQHFGSTASKLILIYAGVSLGISALLTLISYALDVAISGTSGPPCFFQQMISKRESAL